MHLFIVTRTQFAIPRALLYQKVLDIIELGTGFGSTAHHFYIVGDYIPEPLLVLAKNNNALTILKEIEATSLIKELPNVIILHFGASLKGNDQSLQYFIPLTHPSFNKTVSIINKWSLEKAFNKFLKKGEATYAINEWTNYFLKKKYKDYATKIHEAYLPIHQPPIYDWASLAEAKNKLTNGANYFLAFQPIDGFVAMLKEFSIFKKWQQTNMELVFIFDNEKDQATAQALLTGYKFKDAIVIKLVSNIEPAYIAASYTILFNTIQFDKISWIEMALAYAIPLIFNNATIETNSIETAWYHAGEQFNFEEIGALSNHFKLYYKDELYLQTRARMGSEWLKAFYEQRKNKGLVQLLLTLKS